MKRMLIVWHSMTGGSEALARAAFAGVTDVEASLLHADAARAEDLL